MSKTFISISDLKSKKVGIGSVLLIFLLPFFGSCQKSQEESPPVYTENTIILPDDVNFVYHGRIDFTDTLAPKFYWAGSGFSAWFEGTSVEVMLDDSDGSNYYNAIDDDRVEERLVVNCSPGDSSYVIARGLERGIHKLQILRRTDPTTPSTGFKGLKINGIKPLSEPEEPPQLKIEFYGNSITTGHGILDESRKNNEDKATWDNYLNFLSDNKESFVRIITFSCNCCDNTSSTSANYQYICFVHNIYFPLVF